MRETVDEGRTVFLSSHELDEVQRVVDRLAIIKDGRIVVTDTVEGLRRNAPANHRVPLRARMSIRNGLPGSTESASWTTPTLGGSPSSITGSVAPLLRVAAQLDPIDMTARPADLDELFLSYYRTDAPPTRVADGR